jgi:hypothetical protein
MVCNVKAKKKNTIRVKNDCEKIRIITPDGNEVLLSVVGHSVFLWDGVICYEKNAKIRDERYEGSSYSEVEMKF